MLIFLKKSIIVLLLLSIVSSCATIEKKNLNVSPQDILKKYSTINYPHCRAMELSGIFYLFSPHQNFRGKFYLKGNMELPWILEIKWSIGSTLSISEIKKNEIKIYSLKENKIYLVKKTDNAFKYLGIPDKISPEFCIELLTGKWKRLLKNPQKIKMLSSKIIYFFKNRYFYKVNIDYSLKKVNIKLNFGGEIDIIEDKKIIFKDKKQGKIIFYIKNKKCMSTKYNLKELTLKVPPKVPEVISIY